MNDTTSRSAEATSGGGAIGAGRKLRLSDVRDVFRIIGEVRELGADPAKWRTHMVRRLLERFGAELVVSSEVHARRAGARLKVVDIGWGCGADGNVWEIHTEREDESLDAWRLAAGKAPPAAATTAGAGDEAVPLRPLTPVYGGKSFVLSQVRLPHIHAVDQLGIHRAYGAPPFTPTEHKLVRMFHVELGRLWRRDILERAQDPTTELAPRLLQTLEALISGLAEKEVAQRLELSRHTVHNYVKALHARFEVSSRSELIKKVNEMRAGKYNHPQLKIYPEVKELKAKTKAEAGKRKGK